MACTSRWWQRLGIVAGLILSIPLLIGSGCPGADSTALDSGASVTDEASSGTDQSKGSDDDPTAVTVDGVTVKVLFPKGGEQIPVGTIVEVRTFARDPNDPDPQIRIFYDTDNNASNDGQTTIATFQASSGGAGWNTAGISTGQYYVGAEAVGVTPAVVDYIATPIRLVPGGSGGGGGGGGGEPTDVLLAVSAPRNNVTLFSGRVFTIRWSTNLLPGEGTATVFREPDFDEDGIPDGHALRDVIGVAGIDAATQEIDFDTTGVVGRFFIGVTLTTNGGNVVTAYSGVTMTMQPVALWVGDLGTKYDANRRPLVQGGSFQGAIVKGFNFQDNLGSAMIPVDDYDGDGFNDILFAAQYAKPFFAAQNGKGAGEAYLVYGGDSRLQGDIEVNETGQPTLPGVIFTGIRPNPNPPNTPYGDPLGFQPDGGPPAPYSTDGLRGLTVIPDQDNDGKKEIVFSFPWCDSYSLQNQVADGSHPNPISNLGRLENNGHFLRGGTVVVSSANPLLTNRNAVSRHLDRAMQLHEVGQVFAGMGISPLLPDYWNPEDRCTPSSRVERHYDAGADDNAETVTFPCEGFWQSTSSSALSLRYIDPPRLSDPFQASGLIITPFGGFGCSIMSYEFGPFYVSMNQVDPIPPTTSLDFYEGMLAYATDDNYCPSAQWPDFGYMATLGSGFYGSGNTCASRVLATPVTPYGCRILGQTTTQLYTNTPTSANLFGSSISLSGDFLLIGAPMRTALQRDIPMMPETSRYEAGVVYMLALKRPGAAANSFMWDLPDSIDVLQPHDDIPAPFNYIIKDVGYYRSDSGEGDCTFTTTITGPRFEMSRPIQVVGAAPTDRLGYVQGLYDINGDGVDDVAVGGEGTNSGRGAVYILYRRQPEVENDYLLERLQYDPRDLNRLNGLMIIGEQGENLGTALGGLGPAEFGDDYNHDGYSDVLIGVPNAVSASGFDAGEVFVLLGGRTILNGEGGVTIAELMDSGDGVLITGADARDRAGETVACAGDVNGDSIPDILIAAPNATVPDIEFTSPGQDVLRSIRVPFQYDSDGDGTLDADGIGIDRNGDGLADPLNENNLLDTDGNIIYDADDDLTNAGVVYVVFGGEHLTGTKSLKDIGTATLPGMVFVGRAANDELGGGRTPQTGLLSRGLSPAGDLDGDGRSDMMVSSILASPDGKTHAGEVYVIYGFAP